jgi:CcmD family protein
VKIMAERLRGANERKGFVVRNFHFLFAAWMAVWAVFFVYEVSVGRRLARLKDEVDELKQRLGRP